MIAFMRCWAASASLLLSACGLFPDLAELTADAGDAGSTADVAADATTDAGPSDASATDTSTTDAAPDGSDGGFCATHTGHTFCEDFDEPNYGSRWSGLATPLSTSVAVESDASCVSPPNQLLTSVVVPAAGSGTAYAYKHFAAASTVKIQVELLVDSTTLSQLDPIELYFTPPPSGYSYYQIHIDTADNHLGYAATPTSGDAGTLSGDTTFTFPVGAWHEVELDLDMTTSAIAILVDGSTTVQWTVAPLSPAPFDFRLGVTAGVNKTSSAIVGTVQADNVLVDTK